MPARGWRGSRTPSAAGGAGGAGKKTPKEEAGGPRRPGPRARGGAPVPQGGPGGRGGRKQTQKERSRSDSDAGPADPGEMPGGVRVRQEDERFDAFPATRLVAIGAPRGVQAGAAVTAVLHVGRAG